MILVFITAILIISSNNFDKKARACDEAYGYKCSYYQVQTFSNWKGWWIWLHKKKKIKPDQGKSSNVIKITAKV